MKSLMICAPNSNSGKTIITSAVLYFLKQKYNICAFKVGPDQIDRKILEVISNRIAGNLDIFMMGISGLNFSFNMHQCDYAIIEGVMGCFDGIGQGSENSSFETAKKIGSDIILVYSPQGEMFTMIPKLKGMISFSKNRIKGIILNKVNSKLFPIYKEMIESNLNIKVLGFFPKINDLEIKQEGLGLSIASNLQDTRFLNLLYTIVEENIDTKTILSLFKPIKKRRKQIIKKTKTRVAVAMDEAFNMYYSENIYFLHQSAAVVYFSVLHDEVLPECDFVYFGSGLVNKFKNEISNNLSMKNSIKEYVENGGYILAEGNSISYFFSYYDNIPMCGIFEGKIESTNTLYNFGYKEMLSTEKTILGPAGTYFHAAEYHKSKAITNLKPVFKVQKPNQVNSIFEDGYSYKNVLAFFQNINFTYNINLIYNMIKRASKKYNH